MEADHINTLPVSDVENSNNLKKNVSFNSQSNILYFDKELSSNFLEGMEAENISTFPDSTVENCENINFNNVTGVSSNAESETSSADDAEQTSCAIDADLTSCADDADLTSCADDADLEQSRLSALEECCIPLKNLVINLEKLPLNVVNEFDGGYHVCDEELKNVLLKNIKADLSPNSFEKKTQSVNQNEDIHAFQAMNTESMNYHKDTVKTIASDSLLTKNNTCRELKVSLKLLPDELLNNLLTPDKSSTKLQSTKQVNNHFSDQRNLIKPKHKLSKSKDKISKHKKLYKISKKNTKPCENKGRRDSIISSDSVSINLKKDTVPKSLDQHQDDKVGTASCLEAEMLNSNFNVPFLSLDPVSASAMSNVPSQIVKPVESDISACTGSSILLSLLQDCKKDVSNEAKEGIKDSNSILIDSVTEKVNSTENQNLLTKEKPDSLNYCNISFKKPVVVLERLNLFIPEIECEEIDVQNTKRDNLQSTSSKLQKSLKKSSKLKSVLQKQLKILQKKKKKLASAKLSSRDLSVNSLFEDDVPLLLLAKKKKHSASKEKIKNKSKLLKSAKKLSKFDSQELSSDTLCEEDVPLSLFSKNNFNKKQNYFTSKEMIKNKYKLYGTSKKFSNLHSKDKSTKNKSKSCKKTKKVSKFLSENTPYEDDVPLLLLANNNCKKKQNNFTSKKKTKSNKSSDRNPTSNLKTVKLDHSYFSPPSSINALLNTDSPYANVTIDHNYVSGIPSFSQSKTAVRKLFEMPSNSDDNSPSQFSKKPRKGNSEKKTECPTCSKMDSPNVFLKTYLNKFCSTFDGLGKKNPSNIQNARKNQEYGYNFIINKLHTHLEVSCPVKKSYKKQTSPNGKLVYSDASENNIAQTTGIQVSPAIDSFLSLPNSETANEENNYDLSEMLFAAKANSNNQHKSKSRVDKYRLGFLAANNPLRLYNKCLASERYLLSKYEMTDGQRKQIKKMFTSLKNNAAAIEKIE